MLGILKKHRECNFNKSKKTPYNVTLIPGDGIGAEVTEAARRVIDATGVDITWQVCEAGGDVMNRYGTPLRACSLR